MPTFQRIEARISPEEVDVVELNLAKTPPQQQQVTLQPPTQETSDEEREQLEERRQREEEQSMELARRLMAEEAMASYQQSVDMLRQSADQLSQEDYDALQAVLEEEQAGQVADMEDEEGGLSYETMLQLGERIGDVKTERWSLKAPKVIAQLPSFAYDASKTSHVDDIDCSEGKCLICQCEYENDELVRRLPCGHRFHTECVDKWILGKPICPYCRQSVVDEKSS